MLPRLAQATSLRLAATRAMPITRARPAFAISPMLRAYSQNKNNSPLDQSGKPDQSPDTKTTPSQSEPSQATSSESNKAPETPAEEEPIPFHKLPDLTQGIPSTFEHEKRGSTQDTVTSALQAVDQEQYERRGGGQRDSYVSTSDRNRRWWTRFLLFTAGGGSIASALYQGRDWEDEIQVNRHPDIPNGISPTLWWQRARARLSESMSYYQDPEFDKLLPDPDPSFERPYTLVLSLDDLLIHSEWTRQHGWRIAKRPGFDYFIRYLSQYYELVLFTTTPFGLGEPVLRKLDPFRFIMWPLWREATKFENGEIVKDLSYLNRDLSKVIIIDTDSKYVRKQPENAIVLKPWKGDPSDTDLVGLIPFLEYIHTMQYTDVRKILKSFDGKHIPTEFARREAIARREFEAQQAVQKHKKHVPSGFGALGGLLGLDAKHLSMSPEGEINPSQAFAQGKMLQDIARERGQRNYEELEKQIRENGEQWLKEEKEAMEKAQKEMMDSMFGSFGGMFMGKKPEEQPKKE